jgi:hypothetical protein
MRWMRSRFEKQKTCTIFVTGNLGTGKSYTSISVAVEWYKYHFKKDFPVRNICFDIERAVELLNSNELQKGEMIILEEVGVSLSSKNWQSRANKFFNYYMQTFRQKQIFIVFNCPVFSMLDKSTRILINANFITQGIDYKKEVSQVKPLFLQLNQQSGKIYNRYLRAKKGNDYGYGFRKPIKIMEWAKPPENLLKEYEIMKSSFLSELGKDVHEEIKKKRQGQLTEFQQELLSFVKLNPGLTMTEVGKRMGYNIAKISPNVRYIGNKGHEIRKYLRNVSIKGLFVPNADNLS